MILVDTSVSVDHLRRGDPILVGLLEQQRVLGHPFVLGEIATGNLRQRAVILSALRGLPQAVLARDTEGMDFLEREILFGTGLGYIDIHLLASTRLTAGGMLLTRDKRLLTAAMRMSIAA